jgi:spore coat protein A, manganese oxidase
VKVKAKDFEIGEVIERRTKMINTSRRFMSMFMIVAVAAFVSGGMVSGAWAKKVAPLQTPLNPNSLPQFADPLPDLSIAGGPMETIVAGASQINLFMEEFKAKVMPTGFVPANGLPYSGTTVWGYRGAAGPVVGAQGTYIGPVIIATRGAPTEVKYTNNLGTTASSQLLAYNQSTDQALHWADPYMQMGSFLHYAGPIPAVPHLHGGEVPPWIDGGPDAWFLSDGSKHGSQYYSKDIATSTNPNYAIYRYPNVQEAANIWFHDHTLGATRLNVYAGLAGAYVITDPANDPAGLPGPIVPVVIQDRMFDTNGELYFPNVGLNPLIHPYWMPEFIGDTIVVNGKVWPYMNVAPQRYRFFFLNGSNARTYELDLSNIGGKVTPAMWQIGTDGGYLDFPVPVGGSKGFTPLRLQPGERADVIIDFTGLPAGTTLLVTNTAKAPYPGGAPPSGGTTGKIMQFRVGAAGSDANHNGGTFVPSTTAALRTNPIVRLPGVPAGVNPATPAGPALALPPATGGNVQTYRQLTLNEIMGPAGPQEILVNNTKWNGIRPGESTGIPGFVSDGLAMPNFLSERPAEGTTEIWDIINTTADTHPIHLHLTQFQLVSRQDFDLKGYMALYGSVFLGGSGISMTTGAPMTYGPGVFIPAFGPPLDYNTPNAAGAIGGNPDVTPFRNVKTPALPPAPNELGWKDTIQVNPGQVTRIAVRFTPINSAPATAYAFDPSGADYVWHCHIIDHEDNEMMRPYQVLSSGVGRTYVKGSDY